MGVVEPSGYTNVLIKTAERTSRGDITIQPIFYQQMSAYRFARSFCAGKVVLDLGCGEGHGAASLAESAKKIYAVDYSAQAIRFAREKYIADNLLFLCMDLRRISFGELRFDTILAFQVIEHLKRPRLFLDKVSSLLNEGGFFLLSTPNKKSSLIRHPYHFREYNAEELKELLKMYFTEVEILGLGFSERVAGFRQRRKEESRRFFKIDPLRLHLLLPRTLRQKIFDWVALNLSRKIYASEQQLVENINAEDYWVDSKEIGRGIDLIATCRK